MSTPLKLGDARMPTPAPGATTVRAPLGDDVAIPGTVWWRAEVEVPGGGDRTPEVQEDAR